MWVFSIIDSASASASARAPASSASTSRITQNSSVRVARICWPSTTHNASFLPGTSTTQPSRRCASPAAPGEHFTAPNAPASTSHRRSAASWLHGQPRWNFGTSNVTLPENMPSTDSVRVLENLLITRAPCAALLIILHLR